MDNCEYIGNIRINPDDEKFKYITADGHIQWANLCISNGESVIYKKNSVLLSIEEKPSTMLLLTSGVVKSYMCDSDGNEHIMHFHTTGNIICDFITQLKLYFNEIKFIALTEVVAYRLSVDKLSEILKATNDDIEWGINKAIISALMYAYTLTWQNYNLSAYERYITLLKSIPGIDKIARKLDIATYLHITPTQLSRIRAKVARELQLPLP